MEYMTAKGDTFDKIAYKVYLDEELIYPIMEANPEHAATVVFDYGTELTIPDVDTKNDSAHLPPWRR